MLVTYLSLQSIEKINHGMNQTLCLVSKDYSVEEGDTLIILSLFNRLYHEEESR